jgi:hypothetical protein
MIDSMVFVQTQQLMKLFSAYGRVARGDDSWYRAYYASISGTPSVDL